jgi:ABC-type sugar transport system substrate-binding protein
MLRKFVSFTAAALLLVAATTAALASPQGKKIAHLTLSIQQEYIAALVKSFAETSEKYGMQVTTFANNFDPALQAQQMDDAIARKFDMIVLEAASEQGIVPAATRAHQAGVPILYLIEPPKPGTENLYLSYIGEDQVKLGRVAGEAIVRAFKESGREGGNVAAITGSLQEGVAPLRLEGFKDALKADPKIKLVAIEDAAWDTVKSQTIAGELFARFAGQGGLQAMYGMADNQAIAIINAAEAAGLPVGSGPKDLLVVGSNCVPQTVAAIRSGKLYSSGSQIPTHLGQRAAEAAADYFSGKPVPRVIRLPVEMIDKSNIDKWAAACTY